MKLSRSDIAITVLVCLLSSFLIALFVRDLNSVLDRGDSVELGSITFRKRTATRKSERSLRWERLRNHSTVYQGDTIRTADLSEAAVFFEDGTNLDVFENSMLKLDFTAKDQSYELRGGAMHFGPGAAASSRTVRIGKNVVNISGDSDVSLLDDGAVLAVDVASGSAAITSGTGALTTVGANQEFRMNVQSGETSVVTRTISADWPTQGMRLLNPTGANGADGKPLPSIIAFSVGNSRADSEGSNLTLEIAADSAFAGIAQTVSVKSSESRVSIKASVAPGVWFWRVRGDSEETSSIRRFTLSDSQPVQPILPSDAHSLTYRNRLPAIHFSWGTSPEASAYILEIARDPAGSDTFQKTRTTLNGLTLATLAEGTWYWRVTSVYTHTPIRDLPPVPFRALTIVRSSAMRPPVPIRPIDGTLYQIQEAAQRGMAFSWQPEAEAVSYELRIMDRPGADKPVASFTSERPYLQLDAKRVPFLGKTGTWLWNVVWKDREGNVSPVSTTGRLIGVDGKIAVRQSFPPEGYTVADSLVSNTRYSWKSNISAKTTFQIARDPLFADVVQEKEVQSESILGGDWKTGVYYWRIRTYNIDGSVFVETPPRSFTVADPLPEPVLVNPLPGTPLTVLDEETVRFSWKAVPDADYYSFQAYFGNESAIDLTGEGELPRPVFEVNGLSDPACDIQLGSMPDGLYRIHLQAFALDTEDSSRIIGYVSKHRFNVKKIRPVELRTPLAGSKIEGLTARRQGVELAWHSADAPTSLKVNLLRNGVPYPVSGKNLEQVSSILVERLPEGSYQWKILAFIDQFDISSKTTQAFTVLSVPKLPPSTLLEPASGTDFGPDALRISRAIRFTWTAVPGATHYTLRILESASKKALLTVDKIAAVSYTLDDLAKLDRGSFIWEITAQNYWTDGYVEQEGKEATARFSITLPDMKAPKKPKDKDYYGY